MRSRIALGLLAGCVALAVAPRGWAQIEFAPSTLQLKPADEPAAPQPIQVSEQRPLANATSPSDDPAPAVNATPPNSASSQGSRLPHSLPTIVEPQFRNPPRPLVNPYTSASAQSVVRKMPQPMQVRAAASAPARHPVRPQGKPFQANSSEPAISPYLSLYQNSSNQNQMLNYYTIVRPQIEQIEANKKQEAELQKLRAQLQNAGQGGGMRQASFDPASDEGMTVSAHYMDTAQFYHTKRK